MATAVSPDPASAPSARGARLTFSDARVERGLGVVACAVLLVIAAMFAFVFVQAWPSFAHNGLGWFTPGGGEINRQLDTIFNSGTSNDPKKYVYDLHAFTLLYGTALTTGGAVVLGLGLALFSAIFIVEFAPRTLQRLLEPVVRLLAAVPSIIYGLIGILVLVPFVNTLISAHRRDEVGNVVQLDGHSLIVGVLILTVMITPIMTAIIVDALRTVPRAWTEGAAALGVNRWRVMTTISVRVARPAIIAAAVLSTARALGEAIMLSLVEQGRPFAPNALDGLTFFVEPVGPLASTIVERIEQQSAEPLQQTLFAFAAVLLVSSVLLSLAGWYAKQPLKRYGVRA